MNVRNEWIYIISDIGLPAKEFGIEPKERTFRLSEPKAYINQCYLIFDIEKYKKYGLDCHAGRYRIHFPHYRQNDATAQLIVDAFESSLQLIRGPLTEEPAQAIRIPRSLQNADKIIRYKDIVKYNEVSREYNELSLLALGSSYIQLEEVINCAFRLLPISIREPFLSALHYYRESINIFYFSGDLIPEFLADKERKPGMKAEKAKVETAVWNTLKSLEAIIGDPPKNERKLRKKLSDSGIDPDERIGYLWHSTNTPDSLEPLIEKIRKLSVCRDKRAAHGSKTSPNRSITYYELMDFQGCVRYCLDLAIHHELKKKR